jgi:indole-3-glycerol phosphate synthase
VTTTGVLHRICADKRADLQARRAARPLSSLLIDAAAASPPRGFAAALEASIGRGRLALIAELKKAAPSKGLLRADFDPPALARAYARGGAACLSVLTDQPYFQGSDAHLQAARAATDLPVLRKDFTLDPYHVAEARSLGADCVLVILAEVDDAAARELLACAREFGIDALVEVHDRAELDRAAALDATLIGINNRNLKTLEIDLATTERLARHVPAGALAVSESGLASPADLARMAEAGVRAFLVGSALVRHPDVEAATRSLLQRQD